MHDECGGREANATQGKNGYETGVGVLDASHAAVDVVVRRGDHCTAQAAAATPPRSRGRCSEATHIAIHSGEPIQQNPEDDLAHELTDGGAHREDAQVFRRVHRVAG